MNGLKLIIKTQKGFRKGASKVGLPYAHYVHNGPYNPIAIGNLQPDPVNALFDTGALKFTNSKKDDRPLWSALMNPAAVKLGDYLIYDNITWFVADLTHPLPPVVVKCNEVMSFSRMPVRTAFGPTSNYGGIVRQGYSTPEQEVEQSYLTNWPCSVLEAYRGEQSTTMLPGEPRSDSAMVILLPVLPITIRPLVGDMSFDSHGIAYLVSSIEESSRGWKVGVIRTNA